MDTNQNTLNPKYSNEEKLTKVVAFLDILTVYGLICFLIYLFFPNWSALAILISISLGFQTIVGTYQLITTTFHQSREYENNITEINNIHLTREALEKAKILFEEQKTKDIKMINTLRREKSKGYPSLAKAYNDYFALDDLKTESQLRYKKHPAVKSADKVREEAHRRREAEYNYRTSQSKLMYLFDLFPYLDEYIDLEEPEEEQEIDLSYTDDEKQDTVTNYMSRAEWLKLPSAERNDLALRRYWQRRKSNVEIGKMYERYIGYLYEKDGYNVEYTGIMQGFEDLGRDLIMFKPGINEIRIIQCKYWARYKNIRVAHINQLYGTITQYRMKNSDKNVVPMFYTTTILDDTAKEFSKYLSIEIKEDFPMDNNYPCIKCNISMRNGEKIYHLPFDQQYDRTKIIEEKNERYVSTCKEAEALGFRRAFKWHPEHQA